MQQSFWHKNLKGRKVVVDLSFSVLVFCASSGLQQKSGTPRIHVREQVIVLHPLDPSWKLKTCVCTAVPGIGMYARMSRECSTSEFRTMEA